MKITVTITTHRTIEVHYHIYGCENCSEDADISLSEFLDRVGGTARAMAAFILEGPLECPRCAGEILGETLVVG